MPVSVSKSVRVINQWGNGWAPSMRTRMCVCVQRWCISWEPFETVTALSDELMGERERKRESEKRRYLCVWEKVSQRELLLHFLTQARSDWDTYPRDVSSAVLSSSSREKKILWPVTLLLKLNHLNSVCWDQLLLNPSWGTFGQKSSKIPQNLKRFAVLPLSTKTICWLPFQHECLHINPHTFSHSYPNNCSDHRRFRCVLVEPPHLQSCPKLLLFSSSSRPTDGPSNRLLTPPNHTPS